jgi:hypothetical protein
MSPVIEVRQLHKRYGDTAPRHARHPAADQSRHPARSRGTRADRRGRGSWPTALQLLTMVGWAVAFGLAAARFFRWQ